MDLLRGLRYLVEETASTAIEGSRIAWEAGNYWIRALTIMDISFLMVAITASTLNLRPTTVLPLMSTMMVLMAIMLFLIAPLGFIAAFRIPRLRPTMLFLMFILAVEVVAGIVLGLVPLHNDPGLVPMFVATIVAIVLFRIVGRWGWIMAPLVLFLLAITAVFFLGGRDRARGKATSAAATLVSTLAAPAPRPIAPAPPAPAPPQIATPIQAQSLPAIPTFDVGCSGGEIDLPLVRTVTVTVHSCGGSWTGWINRPSGATTFWYVPNHDVVLQKKYYLGDFSEEEELRTAGPTQKDQKDRNTITGIRFKNVGEEPIVICFTLL